MKLPKIYEEVPDPMGSGIQKRRWFLLKTRRLQIVIHNIIASDTPDLHDHAWWNISIPFWGKAEETTQRGKRTLRPGTVVFRRAMEAHRLDIIKSYWSVYITGPEKRNWGYHTKRGWKDWRLYRP